MLRPRYENLLGPLSLLPELRWDRVQIDPDSARAAGVEVLLSRKSGAHWNGWFNYAWSRVQDREDGGAFSPRLGPAACIGRRPVVDVRAVGRDAGGDVSHWVADHVGSPRRAGRPGATAES